MVFCLARDTPVESRLLPDDAARGEWIHNIPLLSPEYCCMRTAPPVMTTWKLFKCLYGQIG